MCTCVDNIKASYTEVNKVTARVVRKSFNGPTAAAGNVKPSIDAFLDAINDFSKEVYGLTNAINEFVEVARNNFCDISSDLAKELISRSDSTIEKMKLLHRKLLASPLYVGMETVVNLYSDAMADYEELCSDLKIFRVDAQNNKQLQATLAELDKLVGA